jgi:hypothetical protein
MKIPPMLPCVLFSSAALAAGESEVVAEPSHDRWMYPSNGTPGIRSQASTFSALPGAAGLDDRWGFFLFAFDTDTVLPAGIPAEFIAVHAVKVTAAIGQDELFAYDPSYDSWQSYATDSSTPAAMPDEDAGRPLELHGAGFRNGFQAATFVETSPYGGNGGPGSRNAFPFGFGPNGLGRDVSGNVTGGFESMPWAVGQCSLEPGMPVPEGTVFDYEINLAQPGVGTYLKDGLSAGRLWFTLSSLHPALQQGGEFVSYYTKDSQEHLLFGDLAPTLEIQVDLKIPLSISAGQNSVTLTWPQFAGFTFALQRSQTMSAGSWATVKSHDAIASTTGSFTEAKGQAAMFYRIAITPTP